MHSDPKLTERLRKFAEPRGLEERRMFGGAAFFFQGHMCVGVYHQQLMLRLGEDATERVLKRKHVSPMNLTGKTMRGWATVDPPGTTRKTQLESWLDLALEFVRTLPAKH
ncbi:MAG: TfoX/Sxy family protein [Planctomycetota bacterium]